MSRLRRAVAVASSFAVFAALFIALGSMLRSTELLGSAIGAATSLRSSRCGPATAPSDDSDPSLPVAPPEWHLGGSYPRRVARVPTEGFFARLRTTFGFRPSLIIDCGANAGDWSRMIWDQFGNLPNASGGGALAPTILAVEASPARAPALRQTGFPFAISLLGASARMADFYASEAAHTGNSVLRENTVHFAHVAPRRAPMHSLDGLLDAYAAASGRALPRDGDGPVLLKLDVQGYELEVLRGAPRLLRSVELILLETSVLPYNRGSPLTGEILGRLDCLGFQVFDVLESHTSPDGILMQLDVVFVRKGSPLVAQAAAAAGILMAGTGEGEGGSGG